MNPLYTNNQLKYNHFSLKYQTHYSDKGEKVGGKVPNDEGEANYGGKTVKSILPDQFIFKWS